MTVKIEKSRAEGVIKAPPSKSMAHRYLICGALSSGSIIKGIELSNDIKATVGCLKALGADVKIAGDTVNIGGISLEKGIADNELCCHESGSTLRFLIPLCLCFGQEITLSGTERLFSRNLELYEELCKNQGLKFQLNKSLVTIGGRLNYGKYSLKGDISSQFISGLMFALPLLQGDSILELEGNIESGSYINLTIKALADFGVRISKIDEKTFYIKGNQAYKKRQLTVEGDYSNAAFLSAFNSLGGNVKVEGLLQNSAQGDRVYSKHFNALENGSPVIDISDCPDLGPILIGLAAAQNGARFVGTHRLKIKESDRGEAMKSELSKLGARVEVFENEIVVSGGISSPETALFSHNDHRIVMTMAVLLSLTGGEIIGAEAVNKSYPQFFDDLRKLGIRSSFE